MHFGQLNVCGEFYTIFWTYLLKMCKKPIQIDGLDSCSGEEGAVPGLVHSQQIHARYNARLVFFSVEGSK